MTTTINASPTNGLVQTADGSGVLKVQSNGVTTNALAWVNFNGTGTVAIRSSYNVSSITDNGTGDYTINFATALADANYVTQTSMSQYLSYAVPGFASQVAAIGTKTTTSQRIYCGQAVATNNVTWGALDYNEVSVAIFGN